MKKLIAILSVCVIVFVSRGKVGAVEDYVSVDKVVAIRPDYSGLVIPPNIAPLNFTILQTGTQYLVKIRSVSGELVEIGSRSPEIIIPPRPWRKLLEANKGQDLYFDVFVKSDDRRWTRYAPIKNTIAAEPIDEFLVYRKIHPAHGRWLEMGMYQRKLSSYKESLVIDNSSIRGGCINCHTFLNNRTEKMFFGTRSKEYGSSAILVQDGIAEKVGTKFGYTSWHPSGRLAVYSINKVRQFFHSTREEVRDVVDLDSLLAYYLVDSKTVKTSPALSNKERLETYPTWSPDGRYLYFCSAPILWEDRETTPPKRYKEIKYDLMRVSYDVETDTWGQLESVLSAEDTGLCILLPRISPDGRWLLFCMCDYGSFPVYQKSSDLYMIDLEAAEKSGKYEYRRLAINSDNSESWHSWSSNSRWIAFSSKRGSGVFTRSYFSYVDKSGKVYKPVLMPQRDPSFYDSCLKTYSVPELVIEPVRARGEKLGRVARSSKKIEVKMPVTMATPKAGALPSHEDPWQERE